jgi:hypothetical protein
LERQEQFFLQVVQISDAVAVGCEKNPYSINDLPDWFPSNKQRLVLLSHDRLGRRDSALAGMVAAARA